LYEFKFYFGVSWSLNRLYFLAFFHYYFFAF
jgi:hypothetical protein